MNLREHDPLADADLLTEENIITDHEGAMVHCPNPTCYAAPGLQFVIKTGECYCGEEMAVFFLAEREVGDP